MGWCRHGHGHDPARETEAIDPREPQRGSAAPRTRVKPVDHPCWEAELLTMGASCLLGPFSTCTEPKGEGAQGDEDTKQGLPRTTHANTHHHGQRRACHQPFCTPQPSQAPPRTGGCSPARQCLW